MTNIRAPYNFVPVSEKVFFPDWADQIMHDIPFSDGVSGEIELEIEAKTPVFVRNAHTPNDRDKQNEQYTSFSNVDNKYFIPATSLKGAIRNVLEIISFGKMDTIANNRYSIRDLYLKKYMRFFQGNEVHCGWMWMDGENKVAISDHGVPYRISHSDLDKRFGTEFSTIFKNSILLKSDDNRTAYYKIKLFGNNSTTDKFKALPLNPSNVVDNRKKVVFDANGDICGTIVFTGQSSVRRDKGDMDQTKGIIRKGEGKAYEFVFKDEKIFETEIDISVENNLFEDFLFIYKDSYDWNNYWESKFYKGERIPIFMSFDKDKNLQHFGLSYLYKLPFPGRVKDYLPDQHKKHGLDLAECIFGASKTKKNLKGRVHISHAHLISGETMSNQLKPYMASPKPTYYPIYLQQSGVDGFPTSEFKTMLDKDAKLKGWKRYPVKDVLDFKMPEKVSPENLSPFIPIKKGSKFISKIRFHNLREPELGALLFAIQLDEGFIHSIGFAKPYGYGQILIKVNKLSIGDSNVKKSHDFIDAFRLIICHEVNNYDNQPQIRELINMGHQHETNVPLEYMDLNEFSQHKKQKIDPKNPKLLIQTGRYLQPYSEIIKKKIIEVKKVQVPLSAKIYYMQKRLTQAKLINHKNNRVLEVKDIPLNIKLKVGSEVEVEPISKGGNILYLRFLRFKS